MVLATVADLMAMLGATGGPASYELFNQTLPATLAQAQLDFAHTYLYNVAGTPTINQFLASTDVYEVDLPKKAVLSIAAHRIITAMVGGICKENYTVQIENTRIDKSQFPVILQTMLTQYGQFAVQYVRMLLRVVQVSTQPSTSLSANGIYLRSDSQGMSGGDNYNTNTY